MSAGTTLGISLGTRRLAVAAIRDGILLHAQVASFRGKWSVKKLNDMTKLIVHALEKHCVGQVHIKIPDVLPSSKGFQQLLGSVNVLCEHRGLNHQCFTLSQLVRHHCNDRKAKRADLMSSLVAAYPELVLEYRREQHNRNAYYYKLFEAVAAAGMK